MNSKSAYISLKKAWNGKKALFCELPFKSSARLLITCNTPHYLMKAQIASNMSNIQEWFFVPKSLSTWCDQLP